MPRADKQNYWFKAKKYGWGWGLPANRKGWISFLVFVAVWLTALLALLGPYGTEQPSTSAVGLFVAIVMADVAALVYVSFKYGEPPKWNWGTKNGKRTKAAKSKSD